MEFDLSDENLVQYELCSAHLPLPSYGFILGIQKKLQAWVLEIFSPWKDATLLMPEYGPVCKHRSVAVRDCEHQLALCMTARRQWGPGISRHVTSSTYKICSWFQFIQSSLTVLVLLLQVLHAAYLKTHLGLMLGINITIWLMLRVLPFGLIMIARSLCGVGKCTSHRIER